MKSEEFNTNYKLTTLLNSYLLNTLCKWDNLDNLTDGLCEFLCRIVEGSKCRIILLINREPHIICKNKFVKLEGNILDSLVGDTLINSNSNQLQNN